MEMAKKVEPPPAEHFNWVGSMSSHIRHPPLWFCNRDVVPTAPGRSSVDALQDSAAEWGQGAKACGHPAFSRHCLPDCGHDEFGARSGRRHPEPTLADPESAAPRPTSTL